MKPSSLFQLETQVPYDWFYIPKEHLMLLTKSWSLAQLAERVDQLRSIEELSIQAPAADDSSYPKIEYILSNSALKVLSLQFTDGSSIKHEQMHTVANSLANHKTLKKLIIYDDWTISRQDTQTIEILANAITESGVEFLELFNLARNTIETLLSLLSKNRILKELRLTIKYVGTPTLQQLDRFVLNSHIRKLYIRPLLHAETSSVINILRTTRLLESLELSMSTLPDHFSELCSAIAQNKSLKTLIFEANSIKKNISELLLAVKNNSSIHTFKIGEVNSEGVYMIAKHLLDNDNNTLTSLSINRPKYDIYPGTQDLDLDQWKFFSEKLANNTTLKHLYLGNFSLQRSSHINHPAFVNALIQNKTLLTLDTYPNSLISLEGAMNLFNNNKTLSAIALKRTFLATDLTKLYEAIMNNQNLTCLNISDMLYHMKEEPKVGQFFGELIRNNKQLKELTCTGIFSNARRYKQYVKDIVPSLKYNQSLTRLNLLGKSRQISDEELKNLADAFGENKTLVEFNTEAIEYRNLPFMKRNREYAMDGLIFLHNVSRNESGILPMEIWLLILRQQFIVKQLQDAASSLFQLETQISYDNFYISKEHLMLLTKSWSLAQLAERVDQLRSIEELSIQAPAADDSSYPKIDYILSNSQLKLLVLQFNDESLIKHEQMHTVANSLANHKTLKKLILYGEKALNLQETQTIEILAKGINESRLEILELFNLAENTVNTLLSSLSMNRSLKELRLRGRNGIGTQLDRFVLSSNITNLRIRTPLSTEALESIINILCNTWRLELFELSTSVLPQNFSQLCNAIADNKSLKTLTLESYWSNSGITSFLESILVALKYHASIHTFKIGEVNNEGLFMIAKHLLDNDSNNKLISLSINRPKCSYAEKGIDPDFEKWKFFAERLANNTTLKYLYLGKLTLLKKDMNHPAFVNALIQNKTLLTLDMYPHSAISAEQIRDLLLNNTTLTSLALKQIRVENLNRLYDAIMNNRSLTSIDLSQMWSMKEDHKFGEFFGELIRNNTRLKELTCTGLFNQRKYQQYVNYVIPSIKYNQSLTSINLIRISTSEDLSILADAFSENITLVKFNPEAIECNNILYLKRNREYAIEALILVHNIAHDYRRILPMEIWLLILKQISLFTFALQHFKHK